MTDLLPGQIKDGAKTPAIAEIHPCVCTHAKTQRKGERERERKTELFSESEINRYDRLSTETERKSVRWRAVKRGGREGKEKLQTTANENKWIDVKMRRQTM